METIDFSLTQEEKDRIAALEPGEELFIERHGVIVFGKISRPKLDDNPDKILYG